MRVKIVVDEDKIVWGWLPDQRRARARLRAHPQHP